MAYLIGQRTYTNLWLGLSDMMPMDSRAASTTLDETYCCSASSNNTASTCKRQATSPGAA